MGAGAEVAGRGARHLIARLVEEAGVRRAVWSVKRTARGALKDAERVVRADAERRLVTGAPSEILAAMERDTVALLTDGDHAAIRSFAERTAEAEKSLTPRIEQLGLGRLRGLEFRLKSENSLTRKVATDLADDGSATVHDVLSNIKDGVRYTTEFTPGEYARSTFEAMQRMREAGFELAGEPKNFWKNDAGYRGVNTVWRDPSTGVVFEMQYHTATSLAAKESTHGIYDFQRLPGLDGTVRGTLKELQDQVFAKVPRPPDIGNLP